MYLDDIDGGPPQTRMYAAFREALSGLYAKLHGSGVAIRSAGFRKGYRVSFGPRPS
jgi:hypothetical protein